MVGIYLSFMTLGEVEAIYDQNDYPINVVWVCMMKLAK